MSPSKMGGKSVTLVMSRNDWRSHDAVTRRLPEFQSATVVKGGWGGPRPRGQGASRVEDLVTHTSPPGSLSSWQGSEGWVKRDRLVRLVGFLPVKPLSLLESSCASGYQSHTPESSGPHESVQLRMWHRGRLWGPSSSVWLESWHWVQGRGVVSGGKVGASLHVSPTF